MFQKKTIDKQARLRYYSGHEQGKGQTEPSQNHLWRTKMCKNCQKMKQELAELRKFKRKHDKDLKKLVGSFTWNELQGKITLGCIRNF